jgi:hypothetical protein
MKKKIEVEVEDRDFMDPDMHYFIRIPYTLTPPKGFKHNEYMGFSIENGIDFSLAKLRKQLIKQLCEFFGRDDITVSKDYWFEKDPSN